MDDEKRILVFSDAGGTGRSYHADLSAQEPAQARPLPAGSRLEGRHRHPGARPLQPHQSGAAAAVPARRHQCEGREALSLDDRPAPRHAGRHHRAASARPAARACSAPRTISKATMRARCAAPALRPAGHAARSRLFASGVRGRDRPEAYRQRTAAQDELPPITTFLNRLLALTIALQNILFRRSRSCSRRASRARSHPAPTMSGLRR